MQWELSTLDQVILLHGHRWVDELDGSVDVREVVWELHTQGHLDDAEAGQLLRRWPTWTAPLEDLLRSVLQIDGAEPGR